MTNQIHPWKRACGDCKYIVELKRDDWEQTVEHSCKARPHVWKLRQFPFKTTNCDDWTAKEKT